MGHNINTGISCDRRRDTGNQCRIQNGFIGSQTVRYQRVFNLSLCVIDYGKGCHLRARTAGGGDGDQPYLTIGINLQCEFTDRFGRIYR